MAAVICCVALRRIRKSANYLAPFSPHWFSVDVNFLSLTSYYPGALLFLAAAVAAAKLRNLLSFLLLLLRFDIFIFPFGKLPPRPRKKRNTCGLAEKINRGLSQLSSAFDSLRPPNDFLSFHSPAMERVLLAAGRPVVHGTGRHGRHAAG